MPKRRTLPSRLHFSFHKSVSGTVKIQLAADAAGELMEPDDGYDAQREPREKKGDQAIMHGFLAVVSAGDGVDVGAHGGHDHDSVDAEGDEGEENELQKAAIGL